MNALTKLPSDCIYSVFDFFDLNDILNTRIINKQLNYGVIAYLSAWIDLVEGRFAFAKEITAKLSLALLVRDHNLLNGSEELLIAEILRHSSNMHLLLSACQRFRFHHLSPCFLVRPFRLFVEASFAAGIENINVLFDCEHHFQTSNIMWNWRNYERNVDRELNLLQNHINREVMQLVKSGTMLAAKSVAHLAVTQIKDMVWQYKMYPFVVFISYIIFAGM